MADDSAISSETVRQMAVELLRFPLAESDPEMLAQLLTSLQKDMRAMRQMNVAEAEPATIYSPQEGDA